MKRTNLVFLATCVASLGLFACNRHEDRWSETNTTSAPLETTGAATPAPAEEANGSIALNAEAKDAGHLALEEAKDAGHVAIDEAKDAGHRASTNVKKAVKNAKPVDTSGVAPGHIAFPPDHGRATGAPNANGSHGL